MLGSWGARDILPSSSLNVVRPLTVSSAERFEAENVERRRF